MAAMIRATAVLFLLFATACSSMRYDLDGVSIPVRAGAGPDGAGAPFAIKSKYVMYVHGLFGEKQPPVGALLAERSAGAKEITDFRVSAGPNLWDWLGTHLSLGFVRLKTVHVTGTLHR
jgi:hypothetical protein